MGPGRAAMTYEYFPIPIFRISTHLPTLLLLRHFRVSNSPDVPELAENETTSLMHAGRDLFPALNMFVGPDAWSMRPLSSLLADEGTLGEDESGMALSTLGIV
jgi:hypothetical protein